MFTRCRYMSLDDMEEQETDALNRKEKEKPIDEDGTVVPLANSTIDRGLAWSNAVKQGIACVIAHSLVIQAGINMAYSAVLLPQLFADGTDLKITMEESTWIASIVTLALPPGSLVVGPLMDKFGRKKICMLTAIPFMCSWIIQGRATAVWHMYVARVLAGLAAGLSTVSIVYVSEISHPNFRPMFLSLNSVFVSFGILITCIFGTLFDWRIMALIYCGISAFSFVALFFVPETPHWLATFKDDSSGAARSLKWTYPEQEVFETQYNLFIESRRQTNSGATCEKQLEQLDGFNSTSQLKKLKRYLISYRDPIVYKPLVILTLLFLFQQLSGAYVIIFYAVDLFRKIGGEFRKSIDAFTALVLLGSFRFVMSIISTILSKKVGRRALLITSGVGMSFTSLIAGLYMYLTVEREQLAKLHIIEDQQEDNVTLICVLGYVCFSAVGFLIIPWTLIGELLPVRVRGVLGGFLVAMAYVFMFGLVKVFPYLLESLKVQIIFFGMSVLNFVAVCFIFFFLPETFGKTFAEIEGYFKKS
ncbi:hypothetical protein Trydic_g20417 [Trypoxylus dichotomus]